VVVHAAVLGCERGIAQNCLAQSEVSQRVVALERKVTGGQMAVLDSSLQVGDEYAASDRARRAW
jgi:hypothetical protein